MRIQLLYFNGCPHWHLAYTRLSDALQASGRTIEVEKVLITTPKQAQEWAFHGSPSVLINGTDPFADPDAPVGLSCRLYQTPGGVSGSPTVGQLVEVLSDS